MRPFYIIHINIWSPGNLVDKDYERSTVQIIKYICDLTQSVISSVIRNINLDFIAKTFMGDISL